jgi:hypothetical protein
MNGIRMQNNFLGTQLYKTSAYGIIEIGVLMSPMLLVFKRQISMNR